MNPDPTPPGPLPPAPRTPREPGSRPPLQREFDLGGEPPLRPEAASTGTTAARDREDEGPERDDLDDDEGDDGDAPAASGRVADGTKAAGPAAGGKDRERSRFGKWLATNPSFSPLAVPVFRTLWLAWLASHLCMWMNDVAAAWLMTSLRPSPLWVAAVQAAATLPVFLLGLPSGALADILDRRLYFLITQIWLAGVGVVIFLLMSSGTLTAEALVFLTFMNGIGLALRWPVFAAIVPEVVSRGQLPSAMGLNGVAMNASRIAGPLLAGAIIASLGAQYVFALNAVLSVCAAIAIFTWRRPKKVSVLPGERFIGAIRVGLRYVSASANFKPLLVRVSLFFFHTNATLALLPLLARDLRGPDPHAFTALLACLGLGAIGSVMILQRLRATIGTDGLVHYGSLVQAAAVAGIALSPWFSLTLVLMVINGMCWLVVANTLSVTAQLSLPDWVRARGMSIFQVALMGSSALGALFWGQLASMSDVHTSILMSSLSSVLLIVLARRMRVWLPPAEALNVVPRERPVAVGDIPGRAGPVVVLIEYRIDPTRRREFLAVMEETRRSRIQHGAISWELLRRSDDPAIYTEMMVDETWIDHLRHFDRITAQDLALRNRRHAFHLGPGEPRITRSIGQRLRKKVPDREKAV
jgi:MFS family permease/quinol monooxygenase YgiN